MSPYDDVTLGELTRHIDLLRDDVKDMRAGLVDQRDLTTATRGWERALEAHERAADMRMTHTESRVGAVEAWQTWALRLVVGAVLMAGLGYLLIDR